MESHLVARESGPTKTMIKCLVFGDQRKLGKKLKVFRGKRLFYGGVIPPHKPLVLDFKIKKVRENN